MEKKNLIFTWSLLIVLSVLVSTISFYTFANKIEVIVVLSAIKFLLIAFIFMELYKAHFFWKFIIVSFLVVQTTIFLLFL